MGNLLLGIGIGFAAINVVLSILIIGELSNRKIPVNYFLLRLFMIKYVNQYKNATISESGKPGSYYYLWLASINLTLVFCVIGIIVKA